MELFYLDIIAFLATLLWIRHIYRSQSKIGLPPGPKPKWLVGNMFDIPPTEEWKTYTKWGKQFGEVVYISVLSTPIVILNSYRVTTALLERRGKIYSGRPRMPMAVDLAKFDWSLVALQYTPEFKARRKLFEQNFRSSVIHKYEGKQMTVTLKMLENLLDTPKEFSDHIKLAIGSIILDSVYGYQTQPKNDKWVALSDQVVRDFAACVKPGAWLVDVMPFLQHLPDWFPGTNFKKVARGYENTAKTLVEDQFAMVKAAMVNGVARPCLVSDALEQNQYYGANIDETVIKDVAAIAYAGGVDTMVTTLRSLFLQMARQPGVQRRAQAELDTVCPDRLPQFGDRQDLPYIECLLMEICRFHAVVPQGMPHRLDEEDVFEGKRLPKGSIIIPNIWGMHHEESVYPAPHEFKPERYLKDGHVSQDICDPRKILFGFGKRQCPGEGLADSQLFISVAMVLKVFNIEPQVDRKGIPVPPELKYTSGILSMPEEFECRITPRSERTRELVMQQLLG